MDQVSHSLCQKVLNYLINFKKCGELNIKKRGYQEIKTPIMLDRELWEISGHWFNYRENMYTSIIDEKVYAIKPMN